MEKRQRYSIKTAISSRHSSNHPSSIAGQGGGYRSSGEPQCSYMYGGLGDLRREAYLCKSPLQAKDNAKKTRQSTRSSDECKHSAVPAVESGKPRRHCNAATAAASVFQMTSQTTAVKINPLCESGSHDNARADVGDVNPVFYGQRTKIRKTKEQEMISAILEVTTNGKKHKRKMARGKKGKKRGGPFILRSRPPLKDANTPK